MQSPHIANAKKLFYDMANELNRLEKAQAGFGAEEVRKQAEYMEQQTEETKRNVQELFLEIMKELDSHKTFVQSKSRFLKRHNSRHRKA